MLLNTSFSNFPGPSFFSHQDVCEKLTPLLASQIPILGGHQELFWEHLGNPAFVDRGCFPAHITTSCLVIHPNQNQVLLVLHKKYGEWVYPGGHAEGDWLWLRSALRECYEETGLLQVEVAPSPLFEGNQIEALLPYYSPHFIQAFDVLASPNEPPHVHFDMVYLVKALTSNVRPDKSESDGISWFSLEALQRCAQGSQMLPGISALTAALCCRVERFL